MKRRGFTLIELLISMAIMVVAIALTCGVFVNGAALQHNSDNLGDQEDAARFAIDDIIRNVHLSGIGAPQGLLVSLAGVPTQVGAVFGLDGTTGNGAYPSTGATAVAGSCSGTASTVCGGTDDLWLLVPDWNAMQESCAVSGANTSVVVTGTGALQVQCPPLVNNGDLMVATNWSTGALLSNVTITPHAFPTPSVIAYTESGTANYSDSPATGLFHSTDTVFRVNLVHYFVQSDANGVPNLYKTSRGGLTAVATTALYPIEGRPFNDGNDVSLVQSNVENLQVAFGLDPTGTGNPSSYVWTNGLSPQYPKDPFATNGVSNLVALRITVVVRGAQPEQTSNGAEVVNTALSPLAVENYVPGTAPAPAATPDGYRRLPFSRVVELPNLLPGNL